MWNRKAFGLVAVVFASVAIMVFMSGCKSRKGTAINGKIASQVATAMQNQNYRTVKMKVAVDVPNVLPLKVKGVINVEVGKALMVSVQPLLGIEMYRLVCNADSVLFLDKMQHTYVAEPYSKFTDKNFNLNYGMIEGLLCNRYFDPLEENFKDVAITSDGVNTTYRKQAPSYYVEFLQREYLMRTFFSTNDGAQYVSGEYNSFQQFGGYVFPKAAVCAVSSNKMSFSMNISFESVEFDKDVSIAASLPSGYQKQTIESLISSLFK